MRTSTLACAWVAIVAVGRADIITTGNVSPDPQTTTLNDDLVVGVSMDGTMTVNSGSVVQSAAANVAFSNSVVGAVTIDGISSAWTNSSFLSVGTYGNGTLNVNNAGGVRSTGGYIGWSPGSTGQVTLDEVGLWINDSFLSVGNRGTGSLNVTDGGRVISTEGYIAWDVGSVGGVIVDGVSTNGVLASKWSISDFLSLGHKGVGTMAISSGGQVVSPWAYVAPNAGAIGTALVSGSNSNWSISNDLYLGGASTVGGTASLLLQDQGSVSVGNLLRIWGSSTLTLDGGRLSAHTIDHAHQGVLDFVAGTLTVTNFDGILTQEGGKLAGAFLPGLRTISGDYTQIGGVLEIKLRGSQTGTDYDLLAVAGMVSLSGELSVDLTTLGNVPRTSDRFTIVQAANLTGTFSNAPDGHRLALASENGSMLVNYDLPSNRVVLSGYRSLLECDFDFDGDCDTDDIDALVVEIVSGNHGPSYDLTGDGQVTRADISDPNAGWLRLAGEEDLGAGKSYLEGDSNLNGAVDGSDFNIWNGNKFTSTGLWSLADFDASGFTDGSDFNIWNGNKFNASDGVLVVPEPVSVLLFNGLVLALLYHRSAVSAKKRYREIVRCQ